VQLSDEIIELSPLSGSDFEFFLDILTCSEIMKHISKPLTLDETKAAFEIRSQPWNVKSSGWCTLPITEIKCGEKVGWIALRILNHEARIAEVGFILKKNVQRRGTASRALKLLRNYAFNELKLNKLVAFCSVQNTASYKTLEKQDFIREGCFKQHLLINNQYVDSYAYGLCKPAL
jgi:RimJ/RimL family protein N-acetyltransferase